jgi:hypothetical protein
MNESFHRQYRKMPFPARTGAWLAVLFSFIVVTNSVATIVTIELPPAGTNISFIQDFSILDPLNGTSLNGQTQSLNIFFANETFLVAPGFTTVTVDFFINQSGAIGTLPANGYCVTGYLIDEAGNPVSSPASIPDSGTMPAQVWPGWPFYLHNGIGYLPATKLFETQFSGGGPVYGLQNGYYINPIIFSGVHFDITYPVSPGNAVIGGRLVIVDYDDSILDSPSPVPDSQYFIGAPTPVVDFTEAKNTGPNGAAKGYLLNFQMNASPYYPYILQTATNLTSPVNWLPFITNSADSNGLWTITITNPPAVSSEFFRVVAAPGPIAQ